MYEILWVELIRAIVTCSWAWQQKWSLCKLAPSECRRAHTLSSSYGLYVGSCFLFLL